MLQVLCRNITLGVRTLPYVHLDPEGGVIHKQRWKRKLIDHVYFDLQRVKIDFLWQINLKESVLFLFASYLKEIHTCMLLFEIKTPKTNCRSFGRCVFLIIFPFWKSQLYSDLFFFCFFTMLVINFISNFKMYQLNEIY